MFLICTENKNLESVVQPTLLKYLEGFTILQGQGAWLGQSGKVETENSLVILVYGGKDLYQGKIKPACVELCKANQQERIDVLNLKTSQVNQVTKETEVGK